MYEVGSPSEDLKPFLVMSVQGLETRTLIFTRQHK